MNLSPLAQDVLDSGGVLEGLTFTSDTLAGVHGSELEISECLLKNCTFLPCQVRRFCFIDVRFEHCDLSTAMLSESTFRGCIFSACRCAGTEFDASVITDTSFLDCDLRMANFTGVKFTSCSLDSCRMEEASLRELKLRNFALKNCTLSGSEWSGTPMRGLDLRSCAIEGIRVRMQDLRGLIVDQAQALILSALLGIVVR